MDAHAILQALQTVLPQILGVSLGDLNDPATWRFDSKEPLSKEDQAGAVRTVRDALNPATVTLSSALSTTADVDNVVRWVAKHVGQAYADAQAEISALAEPIVVAGVVS